MTEERVFSRLVRVDSLPREGQVMTIEANSPEREELASFYKLPAIAALTATLRLDPWGKGGARVTGSVHGELTQVCVVSLEPFPATVDEDVDVRFAPQTAANSRSAATEETQTFSFADEDEPDPIVDGVLRARPRSLSAQARRGPRRGVHEFGANEFAICGAGPAGQSGPRLEIAVRRGRELPVKPRSFLRTLGRRCPPRRNEARLATL
jgi:hypothetical protein